MVLTVGTFPAYFLAVHGYHPFPWQVRALDEVMGSGWPGLFDLPPASGKTALLDVAVFALALSASSGPGRRTPLRIVFVVDRRLVVDDAHARALLIANRLAEALTARELARSWPGSDGNILAEVAARLAALSGAEDGGIPLQVSILRGGLPRDNGWVESVSQPTIVVSTIDQVGSRLLFRGYGVSAAMAPVHAGLLGEDCLLILDEAHLSTPFTQTLHAIAWHRKQATDPLALPAAVVTMTATPEVDQTTVVTEDASSRVFSLNMDPAGPDRAGAPLLDRRFTAIKRARLARAPAKGGLEKQARVFAALAKEALAQPGARVIGVVVNKVRLARKIHELLTEEFGAAGRDPADGGALLLTGRCRPLERDVLLGIDREHDPKQPFARIIDRLRPGRDRRSQSAHRPLFVVGTQAIEAGSDLDFDGLVTEIAAWPSLRQRLGRLDRVGELQASTVCVVCTFDLPSPDPASQDRIYGVASWITRLWLWQICGGQGEESTAPARTVDLGVDGQRALGVAPAGTSAPPANAPSLPPSTMDLFAQTAPKPYPDPDPALWLHGPSGAPPEVQIVWRADAPVGAGDAAWQAYVNILAAMPPTSSEALPLPVWTARSWLTGLLGPAVIPDSKGPAGALADPADIEGADATPRVRKTHAPTDDAPQPKVFIWAGAEGSRLVRADQVPPGATVILPTAAGGCDRFGWQPEPAMIPEPTQDLAEKAILRARGRAFLRLHPGLLGADAWAAAHAALRALDDDIADPELVRRLAGALPGLLDSIGSSPALMRYDADERRLEAGVVLIGRPQRRTRDRRIHVRPDLLDDDDRAMLTLGRVSLLTHCSGVAREAETSGQAVGLRAALLADTVLAARWHDFGKAESRFKALMWDTALMAAISRPPLAKSLVPPGGRERWARASASAGLPVGARHECWSVSLITGSPLLEQAADPDLVLWLVGTHHGHGRPFFDPVDDPAPIFIDVVLDVDDESVRVTRLRAPVRHGLAEAGSGWAERFDLLIARYGYWGLAWLEATVRLADAKRSRAEAEMLEGERGPVVSRGAA